MRAIRSRSLFCKEPQERFAHGPTFLKSDESDSLTDALFLRAKSEKWKSEFTTLPGPHLNRQNRFAILCVFSKRFSIVKFENLLFTMFSHSYLNYFFYSFFIYFLQCISAFLLFTSVYRLIYAFSGHFFLSVSNTMTRRSDRISPQPQKHF